MGISVTYILFLFCFLLEWELFHAVDFIPPVATGPHPRFMAQLPKLKADWAQLVSDANAGHEPSAAWYAYLQNHATEDAGTPSPWLTHHTITMYQITGSASWAQLAWNMAVGNFFSYPDYDYSCCNSSYTCCGSASGNFYDGDNNARIIAGYWVDTYDWIYNALTTAQRSQFRDKLANLFDYLMRGTGNCCSYSVYDSWPLRSTDTDVILHNYFSMLKWYAACADEDSRPGHYWHNPLMNLGGVNPLPLSPAYGGRCQNNCYNTTDLGQNMRTTVNALLMKFSSGGSGMYSTGYNLVGVMNKVAYDWAGLRTAFGEDYFPEMPCYLLAFAEEYISLTTPDLLAMYRWGDDESHTNPGGALMNLLGIVSATTHWFMTDPRQGQINEFLKTMYGLWGGSYPGSPAASIKWDPYDEFFFAYVHIWSGTAPSSDYTTMLPAPGGTFTWDLMGVGTWRGGFGFNDSFFGFEFAPYSFLDHFTQHVGNFQLYRKREWSAYTPISYGRPGSSGENTNTMHFFGWPDGGNFNDIVEFKGPIDVKFGVDWAQVIGAQAGTFRYTGAYSTPSTWQQEYTRNILYVHGQTSEHILIFDRSNILDPKAVPNWNASNTYFGSPYNVEVASLFWTNPRKQFQWHTHQTPVINNQQQTITWTPAHLTGTEFTTFSWVASTTQTIRLKTHFSQTTYNYIAETSLPGAVAGDFSWTADQSSGFLATETYTTDQAFDATLHVFSTYDNSATITTTEGVSTNSKAKYVVITRAPDYDILAFYNVQVGPSLPSPNCGKGSVGCCPCNYDPTVPTIVPTQHYFNLTDTFLFNSVSISTSSVELFLNDLNPVAAPYSVFIDGVTVVNIASLTTGGFVNVTIGGLTAGSHSFCVEPLNNGACGTTTAATINVIPPPTPPQTSSSCNYVPTTDTPWPTPYPETPPPDIYPTAPPKTPTPTPTTKGGSPKHSAARPYQADLLLGIFLIYISTLLLN